MKSMAVVIDYQNVHMTAADVFLPNRPKEDALISPHNRRAGAPQRPCETKA